MTTAPTQHPADRAVPGTESAEYRQRLLDGLAQSIAADGYRNTTVADIVRRARTSRRTFYAHFADKEACLVALLTDTNAEMIRHIAAAVDPKAPWRHQVRQAVEAWLRCTQSAPEITICWIRDTPSLGEAARRLQREVMAAFVTMIQTLCDTEEMRSAGIAPVPRQLCVMLLGGLRELIAGTVEDGVAMGDITEIAVRGSVALLGAAIDEQLPDGQDQPIGE